MPANKGKIASGGLFIALLIGLVVRMALVTSNNIDQQDQRDQEMQQRIKSEFNGLQRQFDAMNRHPTPTTNSDSASQPAASQP
jgi:Na+/glutamate symporter